MNHLITTRQIVVLGAGPAGLAAAGLLEAMGLDVLLIEKQGAIGGHLTQYHRLFPDFIEAADVIATLKQGLGRTALRLNTTITAIRGAAPNFQITTSAGERIDAAAILVATGFRHFDASLKEEYGHGIYDNCLTSLGLDAMLKSGRVLTASGTPPKTMAMVHCVGSRDQQVGNNHCSRVCCINTVKLAIEVKRLLPDCDIHCLYMDIRVFGRGYEELYRTAQEDFGVQFLRGRLSEAAETKDGQLLLRFEDTLTARPMRLTVDMLMLAVGMEGNTDLAEIANLPVGCDRFYATANQHMANNASGQPGLYLAGAATGPKAIMESITDGRAAAAEIAGFLSGLTAAVARRGRGAAQPVLAHHPSAS